MKCPRCNKNTRLSQGKCRKCDADLSHLLPAMRYRRVRFIRGLVSFCFLLACLVGTFWAFEQIAEKPPGSRQAAHSHDPASKARPQKRVSTARSSNKPKRCPARACPAIPNDQDPGMDPPRVASQLPSLNEQPVTTTRPSVYVTSTPGTAPALPTPVVRPSPETPPPPPPVTARPDPRRTDAPSTPGTGDSGLPPVIVGITKVENYPMSCTVWGFLYNNSGKHVDLVNPSFLARDTEGILMERSRYQVTPDYTIRDGKTLLFWPAFIADIPAGSSAPGYDAELKNRSHAATFHFEIIGVVDATLVPREKETNAGPFDKLPVPIQDRIRAKLRKEGYTFKWWENS